MFSYSPYSLEHRLYLQFCVRKNITIHTEIFLVLEVNSTTSFLEVHLNNHSLKRIAVHHRYFVVDNAVYEIATSRFKTYSQSGVISELIRALR